MIDRADKGIRQLSSSVRSEVGTLRRPAEGGLISDDGPFMSGLLPGGFSVVISDYRQPLFSVVVSPPFTHPSMSVGLLLCACCSRSRLECARTVRCPAFPCTGLPLVSHHRHYGHLAHHVPSGAASLTEAGLESFAGLTQRAGNRAGSLSSSWSPPGSPPTCAEASMEARGQGWCITERTPVTRRNKYPLPR